MEIMTIKEQLAEVINVLDVDLDLELVTESQCLSILQVLRGQAVDSITRFTG